MKPIFHSWWFSLVVVCIGLVMFNRYLARAVEHDIIIQFTGELLIWLAITITFLIRLIIQIKRARRPKL